jgi:hypothetical protein
VTNPSNKKFVFFTGGVFGIVEAAVLDDDTAGILFSQSRFGLTEGGEDKQYSAVLTSQPLDDKAKQLVGNSETNPGRSCVDVQRSCVVSQTSCSSAQYWIAPVSGAGAFQVYCDMVTDGGGWTIIASYSGGNIPTNGEQALVSDTETHGNPINFQHMNLNRSKKVAISQRQTKQSLSHLVTSGSRPTSRSSMSSCWF